MNEDARRTENLSRTEAEELLGTVSFGRIAFVRRGRPEVRTVNHVLDGGRVIIRTHPGADLIAAVETGAVVAYEADEIDPDRHVGWSVVATGPARVVSNPDEAARYRRWLASWAAGERDFVLMIEPAFVTGIRLLEPDARRPG